jgi:aryl-alcohol dehydrogenase-like predicted oxidoreductase
MDQRELGRTGRQVSVVGLGTWQLGADWGDVPESDARAVLEAAASEGVTFYDTADVYGDGRSEQIVGRFLADHSGDGFTVATKMGRREDQVPENYNPENFRAWIDRSRTNLGVERLDLVQLHCPPSATIDSDETYDALDALVEDGSIAAYGVSVETVDQALSAMTRPHLATVQIILNALRLKPLEKVLPTAIETGIGIIARVPLASGLLSGKYDEKTTFAQDDHRNYNRDGSAFDVGETFSGVPYDVGLKAAADFTTLARESGPDGLTAAQAAIAWVWQLPGVSTVIPGARSEEQARSNAAAGGSPALSEEFLAGVGRIYDERVRDLVHDRW